LLAIEILPTSFSKLLPVCRDCNSHFQPFELAQLLVRLEHIARFIEYANQSCNIRTRLFASLSLFSPFSDL